jgi:integrase
MTSTSSDEGQSGRTNRRSRANGEGTIYKRRDGRWTARISLTQGKRKDFFGKTRQEVADKLTAAMEKRRQGIPMIDERQTVGRYLTSWLVGVKTSARPKTYVTYEGLVRLHAMPKISQVRLARLSPEHLQNLYTDRLAAGLAAQTVRHLHAVLHRALEQAARWGLVYRNVADLVSPPRVGRHEMTALDAGQSRRLLEAAEGDRFEALYVLALTTGMRLGELLALRWSNVDLDGGSLSVRGTLHRDAGTLAIAEPKTAGSRRHVSLGTVVVEALRRHRVNQTAERLLQGPTWQDNDLVFANEVGKPIEPSNLRRRSFVPLLAKAGLPSIRFHDLRHSAATLLLGQGIHPKIVSERLGHSRVSITLDLYSHVTPTMQQQAADAMDALLA